MVYHTSALQTTEKLREIPRGAVEDFPHVAIRADLESYAGRCSSWHWHEYFEFALVQSGEMELDTQRQTLHLKQGDGYFVNSNVMHLCRAADNSSHARLLVHQFDSGLIAAGSAVSRRYVQPVQRCAQLDALVLRSDQPMHAELLNEIAAAFDAAEAEPPGFELSISICMQRAWRHLFLLAQPHISASDTVSAGSGERIKHMLGYIHAHYAESMDVGMIAESAGVCSRECYRCFKQVLGTTPTLYLMRHRVNAAARQLIETGKSITEIAMDCGFSDSSYFCKVFHNIMGVSPREFRRQMETEYRNRCK